VLTPSLVTLQPQGSQRFTVSGEFSDGSTRSVSAHFTAAGGTITSDGVYTAGSAAGNFLVVVSENGLADTSVVNITVPSATLQSIRLSPSSATISVGGSQQFQVSGTMSDGSTIVPSVTYSASGGFITSDGLYTAGPSAGTFFVRANQVGGILRDSVKVTVTAESNPTPGGQPDIFSWSFEDGTMGELVPETVTGLRPTNSDAAVLGESWSAFFNQDANSADEGAGDLWPSRGTREDRDVWMRFAWKWSAYPTNYQKGIRILADDASAQIGNFGYTPFTRTPYGSFIWDFASFDPANQPIVMNAPAPGVWHWYELHLRYPDGGRASVEIYVDGGATPVFTYTNPRTSNPAIGVYYFFGTVNGGNSRSFTTKEDALAIGTKRMGLPPGAKVGVP
jgi:hypothetical protein